MLGYEEDVCRKHLLYTKVNSYVANTLCVFLEYSLNHVHGFNVKLDISECHAIGFHELYFVMENNEHEICDENDLIPLFDGSDDSLNVYRLRGMNAVGFGFKLVGDSENYYIRGEVLSKYVSCNTVLNLIKQFDGMTASMTQYEQEVFNTLNEATMPRTLGGSVFVFVYDKLQSISDITLYNNKYVSGVAVNNSFDNIEEYMSDGIAYLGLNIGSKTYVLYCEEPNATECILSVLKHANCMQKDNVSCPSKYLDIAGKF